MELPDMDTSDTIRRRDKKHLSGEVGMDHYRYSVMNMQESADVDLDALLKELCALEDQLKSGQTFSGVEPTEPHVEAMHNCGRQTKTIHNSTINDTRNLNTSDGTNDMEFYELPAQKAVHFSHSHTKHVDFCPPLYNDGARSPDNDSAFCDNMSVLSIDSLHSHNLRNHRSHAVPDSLKLSTVVDNDDDVENFTSRHEMNKNVNRDSQGLSIDSSTRGSMMTPSPTQLLAADDARTIRRPASPGSEMLKRNGVEDQEAKLKLEKIKIALEKMKEASIKKIYVKIFTGDGNSKSLLIDERLTVFDVLKILAEKNHVTLTVNYSLVEYHPDLLMERIYEDHEKLVENILMWTTDSNNKLYFIERPVKYDIFRQPHEFFNGTNFQPPLVEGTLYLKHEGKKAWRKKHFVLRASGLYFASRNKSKSSKDLVCLAQLDSVQIYNGIGWKKKYKAPTEYGFALKHPQIQVKASRYIKYLCAEDDKSHSRWIAALRIAKNGKALYKNYHMNTDHCSHGSDDFQNKPSLKLSSSLESMQSFYKDSVVIRPRVSQALTDPDDRPSSIESARLPVTASKSCSQDDSNRNSQQRYRTLRSNSVSRSKFTTSIRERKISTIENHIDPKPIDDSVLKNTKADVETVRHPPGHKRSAGTGVPKLPLTEQTRVLHCAATSKLVGAIVNDTDITTTLLSCRSNQLPPEPDSDEDEDQSSQALRDLAQSASMTFSTTSTSSGDIRSRSHSGSVVALPSLDELFPPPPSPLPLQAFDPDMHSEELPSHDLDAQSNNGYSTGRLPPCTCPATTSARHSTTGPQKGPPPAPPKRSENTRLTTNAQAPEIRLPDKISCFSQYPKNGFPKMHLQSYQTASSEYCDIYANNESNYSNRPQYFEQSKKLNAYH